MVLLIMPKVHSYLQVLLGVSLMFWSLCTLLSGFVTSYWQLAILRFGLGLGYYSVGEGSGRTTNYKFLFQRGWLHTFRNFSHR